MAEEETIIVPPITPGTDPEGMTNAIELTLSVEEVDSLVEDDEEASDTQEAIIAALGEAAETAKAHDKPRRVLITVKP